MDCWHWTPPYFNTTQSMVGWIWRFRTTGIDAWGKGGYCKVIHGFSTAWKFGTPNPFIQRSTVLSWWDFRDKVTETQGGEINHLKSQASYSGKPGKQSKKRDWTQYMVIAGHLAPHKRSLQLLTHTGNGHCPPSWSLHLMTIHGSSL